MGSREPDTTETPGAGGRGGQAFDVVVVGNGVLGMSLAVVLLRRGARVAVVGDGNRPLAASTASGAMNGCFGEVTATTTATAHGRARLEMDVLAARLWDDWLAGLEEDGGATVRCARGTLVIHNTIGMAEIDDTAMTAIRAALELHGEPFESVDPTEAVPWLDPQPTARPLAGLFLPREHGVDSGALLKVLHRAVVRLGGVLVPEHAVRVVHGAGRAGGIALADGTVLAGDRVVLAAGVGTQALMDSLPPEVSAPVPRLISGFGVSVVLSNGPAAAPPDCVVRTPNRSFGCGLHTVPRGPDRVYVGATNTTRPRPGSDPSVRDLAFLLDCAARQLRRDLWFSDITATRVGNRPMTLDGHPLLGETLLPGLWLMTGTFRDGLHTSPLLASRLADRILDGTPPTPEMDLFRPTRPPIQTMDRRDTVRHATVHRLAVGHEWNWSLPVEWPVHLEEMYEAKYRAVAERTHDTITPPPEVLAYIPAFPELADMLDAYYTASRPRLGASGD
ncbi:MULTISPECIES: FAD-dependent oxidoreductase [Kitasatospora]|uniref:Putative oxidoreductase n=1 Tax=Kitasatospora setae (strain ATCC 33774 / DSM 43861 / JCM 3304 / KCC A-0304 / NBRC 14216 / KM-6054) TaxID=452652 RepID=E4MYZ6_KITSK|nr:FAD-dependent oxidoreductase [Kitasatospora setae]BAJ25889.1 putative oxidoreductase [Kitasatospora setae KM-6054]BAJ33389.1 putative oxidoreductase [Kitasatospora setae KM-6054]